LRTDLSHAIAILGSRVVAVGEVGLDYLENAASWEMRDQLQMLNHCTEVARDQGLLMVIHCRDNAKTSASASSDCREVLGRILPRNHRVYVHCFTGALGVARGWLVPNAVFGVAIVRSVKGTAHSAIEQALQRLELSSLVVETDAPYLLSGLASVTEAVRYLAGLQGVSVRDIHEATFENARRFYSLL
jgi:Tat protein secretion system quality control protein TatD with DNase activity